MNVRVLGLVEGLMVYWDEVKDAAQYHVHLYIAYEQTFQEIAMVDVERNI